MLARLSLAVLLALLALPGCGPAAPPEEPGTPEAPPPATVPAEAPPPATAPASPTEASPAASPALDASGNLPGGPSVEPPDPSELGLPLPPRAAAIEKVKDTMKEVEDQWKEGDTEGEYAIHVDETGARYAEEKLDRGHGGAAKNEYYFEDGKLFFYRSIGSERTQDAQGVTTVRQVKLGLTFAPSGLVEKSEKTVNGQPSDLEPGEAEAVLARAREFVDLAKKGTK